MSYLSKNWQKIVPFLKRGTINSIIGVVRNWVKNEDSINSSPIVPPVKRELSFLRKSFSNKYIYIIIIIVPLFPTYTHMCTYARPGERINFFSGV